MLTELAGYAGGSSAITGAATSGASITGTSMGTMGAAGAGGMSLLGPIGLGIMGAQMLGAFGKKKSPKMYLPMLSPEGKATEANLQSAGKHGYYGDLLPMNLTSLVVGQSKKKEGARRRTEEAGATGIANTGGQGYEGLTSGRDVGMIGQEGSNRMLGGIGGEEAQVNLRQNEFNNSLKTLSNMRAMDLKQAPQNLQVPFMQDQLRAGNKAQKGQDIGQMLTMAGMLMYQRSRKEQGGSSV
jgi:hypothetical protein